MKDYPRDMALIRQILLRLEISENLEGAADEDRLRYHIRLMIEAGLLRGHIADYAGGYHVMIQEPAITNVGHDLLAVIKADTLWKKVMDRILPVAGAITIELLTEVAKSEGRKLLGLPPRRVRLFMSVQT